MSEMTELVALLRREAAERDRSPEHFDPALTDAMNAAAAAIERLERERDEARDYAAKARIRENAANDACIHEHNRAEAAKRELAEAYTIIQRARAALEEKDE